MEGPKRIYLFPGIASGYESRTFPDEIEYTRADLTDALAEAAEEAKQQIKYLHGKFQETGTGNAVIARLESALAAYRGEK